MTDAVAVKRGPYDEISGRIGDFSASDIIARYNDALPSRFAEFDKAKRGDALNFDLYGYDPEQDVAVVQVRHAFRRYRNGYLNIHKDYVLVGRNETATPFRHPVGSGAIRAACRTDGDDIAAPVRAAQRWMWRCTERQRAAGIRQGDILLVKERREPVGKALDVLERIVGGSHVVTADRLIRGTVHLYGLNPHLKHAKHQHADVSVGDGWYSIRVARSAPTWNWSQRLGD